MGYDHDGSDDQHHHMDRIQLVLTQKTEDRKLFMEELKEMRKEKDKQIFKAITATVGPGWYQQLSELQRNALDTIEEAIYQDLVEGIPVRTEKIIRTLGIHPHPSRRDLFHGVYAGRKDPKEVFSYLFLQKYDHHFSAKRLSYELDAKLMLSSILYLGHRHLIHLLRERFKPDQIESSGPRKPKKKLEPPHESPYHHKLEVKFYDPYPKKKRFVPAPLPNLEELNEPYEDDTVIVTKPPPPPPPPPPPKKRLPREYCDKLAGIPKVQLHKINLAPGFIPKTTTLCTRRNKGSKICLPEIKKKAYGLGTAALGTTPKRKKLIAPNTGLSSLQYHIIGIYTIREKRVYILGSIISLPSKGFYIHGGHAFKNGEYININLGYTGPPPPPKSEPCDCLKKWNDSVFQYLKSSKCYCKHFYDFGHEVGTYPPEETIFFETPTRKNPTPQFDYAKIFETEPRVLHVEKEFKKAWDTDSLLQKIGDDDDEDAEKKDKKKKKPKKTTENCLGPNPTPEDYLKCALRLMRRVNIAAQLPDAHLVPELKEWMRNRLYGPHSEPEKKEYLRRSSVHWMFLKSAGNKGFGRVSCPYNERFNALTSWRHKQQLNDEFQKFTKSFRRKIFEMQSYVNNLFWATMAQDKFPDKRFRQIFYSYMGSSIGDVHLMHPYNVRESHDRYQVMLSRRRVCLPDGIETTD